jgi:pyruvate dehydrogenase E2 component (dihydrolipoamide acetyltransferase)
VIESVVVQPGQKVPVGTVLALIRAPTEEPTAISPAALASAAPAIPAAAVVHPPSRPLAPVPPSVAEGAPRLRISPFAARRAAELKIDVVQVVGTGLDGAITAADVERTARLPRVPPTAPSPGVTPATRTGFDPKQMRVAVGAAMSRSKREIPHYYLSTKIDFERASVWLEAENLRHPVTERMLPAVLLVKAVAVALGATPELNGIWQDGQARQRPDVHVGWAISLRGGGLIAPALHNADKRSLPELMISMRDLVKRARGGGLRASELSDPTITITSLGDTGVEQVFGVIIPPQLAMVGFGRMVPRPASIDGQIVTRRTIEASLSADHRASDGHRGALFLAALNRVLQEPEKL